jgi:tRNA pseudouridine55 synthase
VFTIAWGVETDTDDAEGRPVNATNNIPERSAVEALLPRFTGLIEQIPPRFSAIKIKGERAYDLARDGEAVDLQPRAAQIERLELIAHNGERSVLEADCGKGTYVRALARDIGRARGCLGHVAALRRTRVGPFAEADAVLLGDIERSRDGSEPASAVLRPVESALNEIPSVAISRDAASRLMRGQSIILRGREAPLAGKLYATCGGVLVAIGDVEQGELVPHRVFNLAG